MKKMHAPALATLLILPSIGMSQGKYDVCVDYYTSGESACQSQSNGLLVPSQQTNTAPRLLAPVGQPQPQQKMQSEVDKYLENYGKPPREFVEFYLNPTQENAMKWVATYQQMLKRGEALSQTWNQADELYKQGGYENLPTSVSRLPAVPPGQASVALVPAAAAQIVPHVPQNASTPSNSSQSFGGFAQGGSGSVDKIGGIPTPVTLNYYFSATCPFCEKMNPQLNEIYNKMGSELKLTCIDVTPLGKSARADPANIAHKLSCDWRMPAEGEVQRLGVEQTPTLFIQRGDAAPVRLSGYVPLAQLQDYISGRAKP